MERNTLYAKFKYTKQDEELVNILEEYLNLKAESIFNFFDSNLDRGYIEIYIIPTKKEYDEINKKRRKIDSIPSWSIGNYHDNIIEYVSLNDYKNTLHAFKDEEYQEYLEYYKKTIIHEYVHYVLLSYIKKYTNNKPLKYLNEGIAQYLSGQRDNMEYLSFNYTLDDILKNNSCYPAWYLMVKYIIENYGKDYLLILITNNELALSKTPCLYEEAKEYYNNFSKRK